MSIIARCRGIVSTRVGRFCQATTANQSRAYATPSSAADENNPIRRVLAYVPGSDEKKLKKALNFDADCLTLDLEDAVSVNAKDAARQSVTTLLQSDDAAQFRCRELGVRVNGTTTPWFEDDMKALSSAPLPDALMLPKVDALDDLARFHEAASNHGMISAVKSGRFARSKAQRPLNLVLWIESARALLNMSSLLNAAHTMCRSTPVWLRPTAVVFGSDDYCADIGATRSAAGEELVYARQYFVSVCKAYQLQAIDAVYIDFKDLDGLRIHSEQSAAWGFTGRQLIHPAQIAVAQVCKSFGFTGRQLIHPAQIAVAQAAYSPSAEKISWARDLIAAFEASQKEKRGAIDFRGQMVDMPLVIQARNILKLVS